MLRKRKKEESPGVGAPLWMLTYGDMITLVLTFFILLYSYSTLDAIKWKQAVSSVKGSLGVLERGTTINEMDLIGLGQPDENFSDLKITAQDLADFERLQQEKREMEALQAVLSSLLKEIDQRIIIDIDERGVVLRFEDSVLFDKGKADLKPNAKIVLDKVGNILSPLDNHIRIEGHTDNLPINTIMFPSNWELSTSRATNVLRYLLEHGLDPQKLSAVGYGEYHPLVENINEENRQKNRRVDIVILRESLAPQEPNGRIGGWE